MPSPIECANEVKGLLLKVVDAMNEAGRLGVKIEFNLSTDAIMQTRLERFVAFQTMKIEQ